MMDLCSNVGTKIKLTNEGGYDYERKKAAEMLTVGEIYEVEYLEVGGWSSTVKLKHFDGLWNTTLFENADEEYDTYDWFTAQHSYMYD